MQRGIHRHDTGLDPARGGDEDAGERRRQRPRAELKQGDVVRLEAVHVHSGAPGARPHRGRDVNDVEVDAVQGKAVQCEGCVVRRHPCGVHAQHRPDAHPVALPGRCTLPRRGVGVEPLRDAPQPPAADGRGDRGVAQTGARELAGGDHALEGLQQSVELASHRASLSRAVRRIPELSTAGPPSVRHSWLASPGCRRASWIRGSGRRVRLASRGDRRGAAPRRGAGRSGGSRGAGSRLGREPSPTLRSVLWPASRQ